MHRAALISVLAGVLAWVLAAVLALGACAGGHRPAAPDTYVALGDSFTSGAGLPLTRRDAFTCGQSSLGYPTLVADAIGAELVDVSCGGATTENGTQPQSLGREDWPPQLDAVTTSADVVSVSLGANDLAWFSHVMFGCTTAAAADPTSSPCARQGTAPGSDLTAVPPQIGTRLEALLTEVRSRAPGARVLLVGYPQPVPAEGTCPELALATGDYPFVRAQWEAMDAAMRRAAAASGATYVDVLEPSEGHDICAGADAWVNGSVARPGAAAPYHPLVTGQAAVAELVRQALEG